MRETGKGGDNDGAGAITGMHLLGATLSKLGPSVMTMMYERFHVPSLGCRIKGAFTDWITGCINKIKEVINARYIWK